MSPNPFEVPDLTTLASLLPAFEIDHLIAHNAMGAVYKARQVSLDRDVAIRVLPNELESDPLFRSTFEAEAKAMARLTHTSLIRVFDTGEADGLLYMIMEYVPGKSLLHSAQGIAIDPKQAIEIILAACSGLNHAHENGITHRDIRPANILLTPEAQPKIGGFGLIGCSDISAHSAYQAPEIIARLEEGHARTDIYAVGMILRELLTGTTAGTEEFQAAAIADRTLAGICHKATHEIPSERYQDTAAIIEDLNLWSPAATARTLNTSAVRRPHRPSLAKKPIKYGPKAKAPSQSWALVRNCAVIAILFCSIIFLWGKYQEKQETLSRLQQEQDSKHPTIRIIHLDSKPAAKSTSSQGLSSALASTRID